MSVKAVEKVWGKEHWIVNLDYCGKLLELKKMHRCSVHHHKKKTETFYVIKGKVLLELMNDVFIMLPGDTITVYAGQNHRFTGIEDSEIIEFSSHHDEEDSYRSTVSEEISKSKLPEINVLIAKSKNNSDNDKMKVVTK